MGYTNRKPTANQQERFLELIAEGKTRQEAAEQIEGTTSTMWRGLINGLGEDCQAFAARYLEALNAAGSAPSPLAQSVKEAEKVHLAHRLLDEYLMRAFDSERGRSGSSNRMLHNLSLLQVEDFKPLLEARVKHVHSGQIGLYAGLPQLDTERLSIEEQRELVTLERRREELIAKATPEGVKIPGRELVAANGNGEVVDAEFVEVAVAD